MKLPVTIKSKGITKIAYAAVCLSILLAVVLNGSYDTQLVIVPNWGFTVREVETGTVYPTKGVPHSFTNTISHIGPIIITEFNH